MGCDVMRPIDRQAILAQRSRGSQNGFLLLVVSIISARCRCAWLEVDAKPSAVTFHLETNGSHSRYLEQCESPRITSDQEEKTMQRTLVVLALTSALALGTGVASAKPGKGKGWGGPPGHARSQAAPRAWTDGVAPGFRSRGLRRGWRGEAVPPGWNRGVKRGWNRDRTMPPGWR